MFYKKHALLLNWEGKWQKIKEESALYMEVGISIGYNPMRMPQIVLF